MSIKTVSKRLRKTRFHSVEAFDGSASVRLHNKIVVATGLPVALADSIQIELNRVLDQHAEKIESIAHELEIDKIEGEICQTFTQTALPL